MLNLMNDELKKVINDDQFYSLNTLKTPHLARNLARVLIVFSAVILMGMFLPWQQNIRGSGTLTALDPANRRQTIESAIAGRIASWKVMEGQFVNKGDTILTLSEVKEKYFDPNLLARMREQIAAKESSIESKVQKKNALSNQIAALERGMKVKITQAKNKLRQAHLKLESDSISFASEKISYDNSLAIFERNKQLFEAGNISKNKFNEMESKIQLAKAKRVSAENKWIQSQTELINAEVDVAGTEAAYIEKISKSKSDLNATLSDLYDSQGSLAKLKNEYANLSIRNEQYNIVAPQSGYLVKALKSGIGETIKEGEAVATIMPAASDLCAEMYIKAMDLPFINTGRKVRVQFDGWPSIQFSGWPNASVGTFGGIVQTIDRVDSYEGKFRILVKPDPNDDEWPEQLRVGSGIKGWVMLDDVPVWFELWRNLNGFPPRLYAEGSMPDTTKKADKSK
ncbi:HlyD family secretion protein [Marinoscillum sp. MHG1-6]|uniref:HlyD family secretion protein n=1 Tax=Marinoscillum sp. MHG1-6 TaxID=2959627 RepID=UPI0021576411|nr:HlyD family secretion protein [Marinoscillum sp. MHG1-6]